jgi:type IV secretory pathway ATPase VirB11/archaellum biosynthesis ATPase
MYTNQKALEKQQEQLRKMQLQPAGRPSPIVAILKKIESAGIIEPSTIKQNMRNIFQSYRRVRPGFATSWVVPNPPQFAELIKEYMVGETRVSLFNLRDRTEGLYHITPFEYTLPEDLKKIVELARKELLEHYPRSAHPARPDYAQEYAKKQGMRSLYKLARITGAVLGRTRAEEVETVKKLSEVLTRYTIGFGVLETLLRDLYVQDIYIDAPVPESTVYVTIASADIDPRMRSKCITNIMLSTSDAESVISRLRYESGRPFSEAIPILESNVQLHNTRATVIGSPLSPQGVAITLRRHSIEPWTLLRLMAVGSLTPLAAGFLSFLIDGNATILVAGPRGAGKTALLGALMFEFPLSQRIVTIEDTLELPCNTLKKLGYKLQSMHIQSPLGGHGEMSATEALRISLRLGESALVIGEVRGEEAKTLYEAMRAGTAGSSVLGTIHANSAEAVYERVVYDLGIPPTSFGATDVIVITGYTRPVGIHELIRRTTQITEILRSGRELKEFQYALTEGKRITELGPHEIAFQNLMIFDAGRDALVETDAFRANSEVIRKIATSWGMTIEDAIANITARANIRGFIVNYASENQMPHLLTAPWITRYNNAFWRLIEQMYAKSKKIDYKKLFNDWKKWFLGNI